MSKYTIEQYSTVKQIKEAVLDVYTELRQLQGAAATFFQNGYIPLSNYNALSAKITNMYQQFQAIERAAIHFHEFYLQDNGAVTYPFLPPVAPLSADEVAILNRANSDMDANMGKLSINLGEFHAI